MEAPMNSSLPNPFELAEMVDKVTRTWADMAARPAGLPAPGPADLPMEFSVDFTNHLALHLVVRGGEDLAEESTGDPSARELAEDAFREFVNILAARWIIRDPIAFPGFWKTSEAEPSLPRAWPAREPDSSAVVMVERFPLELRLWLM
jgi:hypothetical protein